MNKKLLFFLCNVAVMGYGSERFSCPVPYLDMCTVENQRMENQDRRVFCRFPDKGQFFGVLDGHTSSEVADEMSRTFPGCFYRYLEKSSENQAFSNAFYDADCYALNNLRGGSAGLFVYINNGIAHVANVGDSRAVFGNNCKVAFVTQDQTPDREDEYERIRKADGIVYREQSELGWSMGPWRVNNLAMSRSIGDKYCKGRSESDVCISLLRAHIEVKGESLISSLGKLRNSGNRHITIMPKVGQVIAEPEYTSVPLADAHRWLIIASDGLWDVVCSEEAIAMVQCYYEDGNSLEGVSAFLSNYAIEKGSKDNITILVIDLLQHMSNKK